MIIRWFSWSGTLFTHTFFTYNVVLRQLFDTVNGKYQEWKKNCNWFKLFEMSWLLLSALHFPSETTCSCKQDTKERYWGQQFWQVERDISVWVTEMTRPVTVDHLQSSGPEYSGQTKPKWSVPFMNLPKFPEFWLEWKAPVVYESATLILNPLSSRASGNCLHMLWIWNHVDAKIYTNIFLSSDATRFVCLITSHALLPIFPKES